MPEGCTTLDRLAAGSDGAVDLPEGEVPDPAQVGGLPTTVVCDLGELAPGTAAQLRDLAVLVPPASRGGDGTDDPPTATVVLKLQDPVVDPSVPPLVHDIAEATITLDPPEN